MSVTIAPTNNLEFCESNNLVKVETEDCLCVGGPENKQCHYCGGTKIWESKIYPFEMNVANGNFSTIWAALGLEFDYCGEIDATILSNAIKCTEIDLIRRANYVDGNYYCFGIDTKRANYYLDTLKNICSEAIRRNTSVSWG